MATPALALVKSVGLLEREKDVDMSTPEDVAARAADSMAFLSDVERKAREACNYEVSDAYQNAWLVIRDLQTALARVKELCDARPYLNSELLVAQVYRALGIDPYKQDDAASPAPAQATGPMMVTDSGETFYCLAKSETCSYPRCICRGAPTRPPQATPPAEARDLVEDAEAACVSLRAEVLSREHIDAQVEKIRRLLASLRGETR